MLSPHHSSATGRGARALNCFPQQNFTALLLNLLIRTLVMQEASLCVIIVSHNESDYLCRTVESLAQELPKDGEIIVVDDGSTDGSTQGLRRLCKQVRVFRPTHRLGAARARNFGARRASGKIVLFADAHITALSTWAKQVIDGLKESSVGAVGPVLTSMRHPESKGYGLRFTDAGLNIEWLNLRREEPYPVPLLGSFFMGMRKDTFESVGGFDAGMETWGMEDLELSFRLWSFGYRLLLLPQVDIAHLDRENDTYPDYQLDWETGVHNVLRMAILHFGAQRIERVLRHYGKDEVLPRAMARLIVSNAWELRRKFDKARRFGDDWYFQRFKKDI
jgi:GT2 family glycosyltransferase